MKKILLILILVLCASMFGAKKIQFSKNKYYNLGIGEQKQLELYLPKARNYSYHTTKKLPFSFEKMGNGKIKITYDIYSIPKSDRVEGKVYKVNFGFRKKNIGKNYSITISAKYQMELLFQKNDKQILDVNFTPTITKSEIFMDALLGGKYIASYNKDLFSIDKDDALDLKKGVNKLEVSLFTKGNFRDTLRIQKTFNNKLTTILKIAVQTKGFGATTKKNLSSTISSNNEPKITKKLPKPTSDLNKQHKNKAVDISKFSNVTKTKETSSGTNDFIYFSIIGVLLVLVVFLVIKIALSQKVANSEKYEMFYTNVASLLEIDIAGKNIDTSLDEIMVKLLKLTDNIDAPTSSMDILLDDSNNEELQSRYIDVDNLDLSTRGESTFQNNYDFLNDEANDKNKKNNKDK